MRVRFLNSVSLENASYAVGSICEVEDKLARQWANAGWCAPSKEEPTLVVSRVEMSAEDLARAQAEVKAAGLRGRRVTARAQAEAEAKAKKAAKAGR